MIMIIICLKCLYQQTEGVTSIARVPAQHGQGLISNSEEQKEDFPFRPPSGRMSARRTVDAAPFHSRPQPSTNDTINTVVSVVLQLASNAPAAEALLDVRAISKPRYL